MKTEEKMWAIEQNLMQAEEFLDSAKSVAYDIKAYGIVDKIQACINLAYAQRAELQTKREQLADTNLLNRLQNNQKGVKNGL